MLIFHEFYHTGEGVQQKLTLDSPPPERWNMANNNQRKKRVLDFGLIPLELAWLDKQIGSEGLGG